MKQFLRRVFVRLFIILFAIFLFASWVLATPYACLDYCNRREHFRDMRDLISKDSWLSLWSMIRTGVTS